MKNIIREYFYYSKLERNGIFVLAFLCICCFLFPKIYVAFSEDSVSTDFSDFKKEITDFENVIEEAKAVQVNVPIAELFYFDPNTVSDLALQKLGLSPKVIRTFLNFRNKGGKFFKKEDFKKVYGIKENDYTRLEPYIQIENTQKKYFKKEMYNQKTKVIVSLERFEFDPNQVSKTDLLKLGFSERAANNLIKFRSKGGTIRESKELAKIYGIGTELYENLIPFIKIKQKIYEPNLLAEASSKRPENPTKEKLVLDINTAQKEDWEQLYGIGPFYAKRIINFREKLGGFHSIEQVGETYNLPDSTFQKIRDQLIMEAAPSQINLNTVSLENLKNHPYLKYNQAKVIINYRTQHGAFKSIDDLNKIVILKPDLVEKIRPYLKLE